ncbi:InlB B-repeat-containing protein [Butyrivibrio sp. WCD2001]|uniref:InlB B-repeat-containing protein n=1 Tax=Butyrivibrio sp. WCD2001 TaxID=1280681 RepID=UPI00040F4D7C|nr:leucine-rich repeat protein [Butyrivibrio sp. WCD2001]
MMKAIRKGLLTTIMSAAMALTILPAVDKPITVHADWNKTVSGLGASVIGAPEKRTDNTAWKGSYIWYGSYNGNPVKYRVLSPKTTTFGGTTMLLDCDNTLYEDRFNSSSSNGNKWATSAVNSRLNGDAFLNKPDGFTGIEKEAMANSTVAAHNISIANGNLYDFNSYTALNGEKVFLLDVEDVLNPDYGYSTTDGWVYYEDRHVYDVINVASRKKDASWLLRNGARFSSYAGCVGSSGQIDDNTFVSNYVGISPAFNLKLDSILFTSVINGSAGVYNSEYKLTLLDETMTAALQTGKDISVSGKMITIPYTVGGVNAANASQVSVMILDKEYKKANSNNANVLYYGKLNSSEAISPGPGEGTFELPYGLDIPGWGTDYHVYIFAEDVNGIKQTDYASAPIEVKLSLIKYNLWVGNTQVTNFNTKDIPCSKGSAKYDPKTNTLTFNDATINDGYSYNKTKTVGIYAKDMNLTIKGTVKIDPIKIDGNSYTQGVFLDCTNNKTLTLNGSITIRGYANGFLGRGANIYMEGGTLDLEHKNGCFDSDKGIHFADGIKIVNPTGAAIRKISNNYYLCESDSSDVLVKKALITKAYTVSVSNNGNGSASASITTGKTGDVVILTAIPDSGYRFKEWMVASGDVTITDNSFRIGVEDVKIIAKFELITCTVTFDSNGGSGSMAAVSKTPNSPYTLPACTFTAPEGKEFDKWDLGVAGTTIIITDDMTIRALWKDKTIDPKPDSEPTPGNSESKPADSTAPKVESGATEPKAEGTTFADLAQAAEFVVTSADKQNPTVDYKRTTNKNAKKITVPQTVTLEGITYNVTGIASKAFNGCKKLKTVTFGNNIENIRANAFKGAKNLKTINVKSSKLTKDTLAKKAFKGIGNGVTVKVPKKMKKTYEKLFVKKGLSKSVKIK